MSGLSSDIQEIDMNPFSIPAELLGERATVRDGIRGRRYQGEFF